MFEFVFVSSIVSYLVSHYFSGVWGFCPVSGLGISSRIFGGYPNPLLAPLRRESF